MMSDFFIIILIILGFGSLILTIIENLFTWFFVGWYYRLGPKIFSYKDEIEADLKKLKKGKKRETLYGIYKISKDKEECYIRARSLSLFFGYIKLEKFENHIHLNLFVKALVGPIGALSSYFLLLIYEIVRKGSFSPERLIILIIIIPLAFYFIISSIIDEKEMILRIYEEFKEDITLKQKEEARYEKASSEEIEEYVYGFLLKDIAQITEVVEYLLTLEAINEKAISTEFVHIREDGSFISGGIEGFRKVVKKRLGNNAIYMGFTKGLEGGKYVSPQDIQQFLVGVIENREILRRKALPEEEIIISIQFEIKDLKQLGTNLFEEIGSLVKAIDSKKMARMFLKRRLSRKYRRGWINIYPFDIEGKFWQEKLSYPGEKGPILEVRYYGSGGCFKYLLEEVRKRYGISYIHLEGGRFPE